MQKTSDQIIRELTDKIKDLERALQKAQENAGYGLKREDKHEIFEERAQNALPVLKEVHDLRIDNADDVDHLIIEGDNYHLLSALNYTHKGKIDVIYIDPPYNTGKKDFTYNDNYVDGEDDFRHSTWLSFMNKRLRLAKELLKDNGVIFISIDDNEFAQLKLLCDEIFGEKNFVSNIIWQDKYTTTNDKQGISSQTDYIMVYAKNSNNFLPNKLPLREEYVKKTYTKNDEDGKGLYRLVQMYKKKNPISYEVTSPTGKKWNLPWNFTQENFEKMDLEGKIFWGKNGNAQPQKKVYLSESTGVNPVNFLLGSQVGFSSDGGNEVENIFGDRNTFSYPKPSTLINFLLKISSNPNSTILDFFAGSGTTGHAVLELNKEDSGKRQFILCSNTENTKENPDKNICRNITYERVKRVMQGYTNAKGEAIEGLGGGNLRYYTTDFIKKEKTSDDLRQKFIYLCDELLCIKEDTFTVLDSDFCSDQLKCYYKKDHYTVILYDLWQMDKLQQLIAGLDGQISLYLFSLSKDAYEEELLPFVHKVTIENVPDEILETYHKIF